MADKHPFLIEKELAEKKAAYHDAAQDLTPKQALEHTNAIDALIGEVQAAYSEGAKDCPTCGGKPVGMKPRRGIYEVGCLACVNPDSTSEPKDNLRSQGELPEQAVYNWNQGEYYLRPGYVNPVGKAEGATEETSAESEAPTEAAPAEEAPAGV